MTTTYYNGKNVILIEYDMKGVVENSIYKRGEGGVLGIRLIVMAENGKKYELHPHQIKIDG